MLLAGKSKDFPGSKVQGSLAAASTEPSTDVEAPDH